MAYATINLSSFHQIKGDNIQTTEDIATWNPVASGAITFSKEPLSCDVQVILDIEGSGRISLGIIKIDPQNLKDRPLYKLQDIPEYIQIHEVRVHRQKCSIKSTLEPGGERVVTNYNDKKYTQSIRPGSDVWLAVYVKFGEVTLRLNSEVSAAAHYTPILSEVKGVNLEFCTNGKNEVRTISFNPAAICFISKPLDIGQKISLICEPLTDNQGVLPSRFYLKINIINKEPKQLQQQYQHIFTVTTTKKSEPSWVCSVIMEMKECNGQLSIERSMDSITFSNEMNERTKEDIYTNQKSELWVALELYRVSVRQVVFCALTLDIIDDDVGYLTPFSLAQAVKLRSEEQNKPNETLQPPKPHPPRKKEIFMRPYTIVNGNESNSPEEGTTYTQEESSFVSSKVYPAKPAEDHVRFEASFNGYFDELVADLSAYELCDHLLSLKLMTEEEYDTITSRDTSHNQNRQLLRLLRNRPVPKSKFEAALKKSGNGHLVQKFLTNKTQ